MSTDPSPIPPGDAPPEASDEVWEEAPYTPPATPAGPGRLEATLRRAIALIAGLALVVGFFLPWRQATGLDAVSISGLDIMMKGLMDPNTRFAVAAVPLCGLVLLVAGYIGRTSALVVSLIAGLGLVLVGAWQVLSYLAQSIGLGLWVVAGAAFFAVIGGIPWQRIMRGPK